MSDLRKDFWKNILKDCVFNLYLLFELKRNFEATNFWKRNFTRLGKFSLKTTWIKSPNRVHKEDFKRFYFLEVSFSCLNSGCSKLFKKENTLFLIGTKLRKKGFRFEKFVSFQKEKT